MYTIHRTDEYLQHHGILGQKWGVRRYQNPDGTYTSEGLKRMRAENKVKEAKAVKKAAGKQYTKDFNDFYNHSHNAYSLKKSKREANAQRLATAQKSGQKSYEADKAYKEAKKELRDIKKQNKQALHDTYVDIQKKTSVGEKLIYNNATRRAAANYVVNHDMTMEEAKQKSHTDAWRNAAAMLAIYGGVLMYEMKR